jgi:catechol 2,3-dioxygenase
LTSFKTSPILAWMATKTWPLHGLTLKALDLSSEIAFYEEFGFRLTRKSVDEAVLTAGEGVELTLNQLRHGRARPPGTAGLFHFALLLPDRLDLASFVHFTARTSFRFVGAADHLVSESLYFSDPEGNGIEVYADRPREQWQWNGTTVNMATLPLELRELAGLPGPEWAGFPLGTRLGHMHLTVGDLDLSQEFYKSFGLRLTLDWGSFRFFSWEGYHHHLALNLMEGRGAAPISPEVSGLHSFSVRRGTVSGELVDPNGIKILP